MKISKILKSNKRESKFSEEELLEILSEGISSKKMINIMAEYGINIACIVEDRNDRKILVSSFGVTQLNTESLSSDNLDYCDSGLVSCGLYDENCLLTDEEYHENFDFIVFYDVELITCGKKMTGYVLIEEIGIDLLMAIDDCDYEAFQLEIEKLDESKKIYIPTIEFTEE